MKLLNCIYAKINSNKL